MPNSFGAELSGNLLGNFNRTVLWKSITSGIPLGQRNQVIGKSGHSLKDRNYVEFQVTQAEINIILLNETSKFTFGFVRESASAPTSSSSDSIMNTTFAGPSPKSSTGYRGKEPVKKHCAVQQKRYQLPFKGIKHQLVQECIVCSLEAFYILRWHRNVALQSQFLGTGEGSLMQPAVCIYGYSTSSKL
ncbi:hypothetical protein MAR_000029 [Mya arenaria]|uniref:Uncharacterized protein n=1 Tax=Mya arenaria TaxID=6604 RepID=A0ABY7FG30_MYAAR|nr:hypothetical protein MAR_000029 [Mya arenaria]